MFVCVPRAGVSAQRRAQKHSPQKTNRAQRLMPVLQAIVSLAAVVFVVVNLVANLVYPLLDPRVKLFGGHRY